MTDRGDISVDLSSSDAPQQDHVAGKNAAAVLSANQALHDAVKAAALEGDTVLTVGGDHSVAMGSIAGALAARPTTGVIWVDAHADINLPSESLSGNIHGMPVAFLMKLLDVGSIAGANWLSEVPTLAPQSIVYIGLRDVDAAERALLRQHHIKRFTMREVDKYGIGRVMEMAMDHLLGDGARPIHLSFDIDAVDPSVAPATGTSVQGGLNYREAHYIAEEVAASGMLGSMDMVEVNPLLGATGKAPREVSPDPTPAGEATIKAAVDLIQSAFGKNIL